MRTVNEINNIVGEYKLGDVVLITGKASSGKTLYMVYDSVNASLNKEKVLFCSVDTKTKTIEEHMRVCLNSINDGIKTPIRKTDISLRQFEYGRSLIPRLKTFLNLLRQKGKKHSVVYVEYDINLITTDSNSSEYLRFSILKNLKELKALAVEQEVVLFVSMQTQNCTYYDDANYPDYPVDFIFCLEKNKNSTKENLYFNIIKVREKKCFIQLKCKFDFAKINYTILYTKPEIDKKTASFLNSFDSVSTFSYYNESSVKTLNTFVFVMINSLLQQYKNVLYIRTTEDAINDYENSRGKLHIVNKGNFTIDSINSILDKFKFVDYVVIDNIHNVISSELLIKDDLREFKNISQNKKVSFIIGSPTILNKRKVKVTVAEIKVKTNVSSFSVFVEKYKVNVFKKIFNFFMRQTPLLSINVLKSRYGKCYKTTMCFNNKTKQIKII